MTEMYLLSIAVILIATKLLGDVTNRVHLTQVVGALLAGVVIGPGGLGWISETQFITQTAEIGVILLMFTAGLETDSREMKKNMAESTIIALLGVIVPLIGGTLAYYLFFARGQTDYDIILKSVFVGVILTATSVSITVEALRELGRLEGKVGTTVMGAAVIDDIIGILVLTIVLSLKDESVSVSGIVLKICAYGVLLMVLQALISRNKNLIDSNLDRQRITTYSVAACFIMAFLSESVFDIADITGAYMLGLFLSQCKIKAEVTRKLAPVSYIFFTPVFFASIGLKVDVSGLGSDIAVFSLILILVAVLSKLAGCGLGALICRYDRTEAKQIGIGMISRGEVALIVAQKGYAAGMVDKSLFPAIVIVVIVTTMITPVLLKRAMVRD